MADIDAIRARLPEIPSDQMSRHELDRVDLLVEVDRLHSWDGLMSLLDEHWPEGTFPTLPDTDTRDSGPRIISLTRAVDRLRAQVQRVEALTGGPFTAGYQPYAVEIDGDVILTVDLDDLRAALDRSER